MLCNEIQKAAKKADYWFVTQGMSHQREALSIHPEAREGCHRDARCRLILDANRDKVSIDICCNLCWPILIGLFPVTNTVIEQIRTYMIIPPGRPCTYCLICKKAANSARVGICARHERRIGSWINTLISAWCLLGRVLLPELANIITGLIVAKIESYR